MNHKRIYKVLPLSFPFTSELCDYGQDCLKEEDLIEPIFKRDGLYLNRITGLTWLEKSGKAWKYIDKGYFLYQLRVNQGNNRIHPEAFKAIKVLMKHKLVDRKLYEIYSTECFLRSSRESYVSARIHLQRFMKEFK